MLLLRIRKIALLALLVWTVCGGTDAAAYVHIRSTQNGAQVQWSTGSNVVFRANTANASGLSPSDIFSILSSGIQRWMQAAQGGLGFTYFQGTDTSRYPNRLGEPQDNSIFFTSQDPSEALPCSVIGLTEVWYNQGSGQILRTDMRLNDTCFRLTTNPADTRNGSYAVYLGDVVTHELGHALGLDHSQNAQSTMFYAASKEMFKPSCDDQAAILTTYAPTGPGRTAMLSGRVIANGSAVFGAVVNAIDLDRGINVAHALTEKDGTYRIAGLEPGVYGIMAEPYFPGASALNSYYSGISTGLCGSAIPQRTFATGADGTLARTLVQGTENVDMGTLTLSCNAPTSPFGNTEANVASAPSLSLDSNGVTATASVFNTSSDHYYKIPSASGTLTASALSYTLYSKSDVQVEFLDSSGRSLSGQSDFGNVFYSNLSGYANFDANAAVLLAHAQDVYVHVFTRANLSSSYYPGGAQGMSTTPYYVLSVSNRPATAPVYASNARCEQSDAFTTYSQPGEPPAYSASSGNSQTKSAPGCGSIYDAGGSSGSGGSGGIFRLLNFALLALALTGMRRKLLGTQFF